MFKWLSVIVVLAGGVNAATAQCSGGSCAAGPVVTPNFAGYTQAVVNPNWDWRDGNDGTHNNCLFQNGVQIGGFTPDGFYRPLDAATGRWGPPGKLVKVTEAGAVINYGLDVDKIHDKGFADAGAATVPNDKAKPRFVVRGTPQDGEAVRKQLADAGALDKVVLNTLPPGHWQLSPGLDYNAVHVEGPPREDGKAVMVHSQPDTANVPVAEALRKADPAFNPSLVPDLRIADPLSQILTWLKSPSPLGGFPWWQVLAAGAAALWLYNKRK